VPAKKRRELELGSVDYFSGEMFGATVVGGVLAGCCNGPTSFNLSGVSRDHKEGLSSSLRAVELSLFPVSGVCGVLFGHHRPLSTICWQYNIPSRVCPVVDAKLPTCKNSLL
jgi:hypothetical protein